MLTVEDDPASVDRKLTAGELSCPVCDGSLRPWAFAARRVLRGFGRVVARRPRRARCRRCGRTHVLLPVVAFSRRADLAAVIGAGLVAAASGLGARRVAGVLGRPVGTVRGWLRRLAGRAEAVRRVFTTLLVAVGVDPVVPAGAGSPLADAVEAVLGAAVAVASRWPRPGGLAPWRVAAAVTHGTFLAPQMITAVRRPPDR
ncbi:hypothetical protein [Pseudofrankia sp. DC12]|uniref:hypothetical protein n=1 Tax=Pseudofrankia sp. DC12 TaxID=683315 RepID=UPI0005F81E20|nr:hypothetical protein [Pseudofrankia sp. DC12]